MWGLEIFFFFFFFGRAKKKKNPHHAKRRIEFGYKTICTQFAITHYVTAYKIIHVYFSHMTYLMSHVTSLNNTRG
jgi:hypothetical protein